MCRAALRERAGAVLSAGALPRTPLAEEQLRLLDAHFGPLADDVLTIVDAFALGMARMADGSSEAKASFMGRLDMVLNGLDHNRRPDDAAGATAADAPPHMIQSELWQVLHHIRESAELSYSREIDLVELDRRILFLVLSRGPLAPAEIAGATGVDKAQVSRSVKRMLEMEMVQREQLRAPLRLTPGGEALGRRLLRVAELRNRELTFDITDEELAYFVATIEILLDRAVALYERERGFLEGTAEGRSEDARPLGGLPARRSAERSLFDRTRITSPLMTLNSYFNRSGALAFKRLTGLSKFEAFVLSEIGRQPPIEWAELVAALRRDHSQSGRTITALMERGLIERGGKPGRRNGWFAPTEVGARLYDIIYRTGQERSVFLLAPLAPEQRMRFMQTFDKLRRNALAQLHRERAFSEFDARPVDEL